ncbi:MAG: hypothetical protein Q7R39_08745 [Dehalococcoidia bacterium]|nr:hypothetical protein [Dehalococcoidia bacterium]
MRKAIWIAVLAGALLTVLLVGPALAGPPAPGATATPAVGDWGAMRDWMDAQWGQGFFDRMHGSPEGMVETCNTMMGGGGMMGSGTGSTTQGHSGGMMGPGSPALQTGGWGSMMRDFAGGAGARMRAAFN